MLENLDAMSQPITVNLHDPDRGTINVTVQPTDAVNVLARHVAVGGRRLLCYKGSAVMTAFTFQFFGINNGDDIYVVKLKKPAAVRDRDYFNHNVKKKHKMRKMMPLSGTCFSPARVHGIVKEAARLMDIVANRCEWQRPKVFSQREDPLINLLTPAAEPTSIGASLTAPSTEALPMFW